MLDPSEVFVAPICAAREMTLVLPRSEYEHRCLIVTAGEKPIAICLDELQRIGRFLAFECDENDNWKGMHIPGVRIELDETSLHDAEGRYAPRGSMVRVEDRLTLWVELEGQYQTRSHAITIHDKLPPCAPHMSACFMKWQIVLGEGEDKRVLWSADATPEGR